MESMATFATSPMSSLVDAPVRYDLAASTTPALRVGDLVDPDALADMTLGYGSSPGDAELRALIGAEAGVDAGQVLLTVGAIEGMFLLAQDRLGPGDAVVLASPCFPPARSIPEGLGARVDVVAMRFGDGYRLPMDAVADALTPKTRLVSVASPQNPSGVRLTEGELHGLLTAVEERAPEAVVLVDETYRQSTYGNAPVPASAAALSPRVVTCGSVSKAHGAPGLRLGWLTTTDADLYERLRNAKHLTTIACSAPAEFLAVQLLRRSKEVLAPRAALLQRALTELQQWVRDQPVEFVRPDGGALCCLRLPRDRVPDAAVPDFYSRLAQNDARVAPGSWFGDEDRVFRLGFGHLPPAEFTEALARLADALLPDRGKSS
ncbi:aminotransferase [Modestobacter caceresii]|uniref:Aminotransferase n=2 Tax=Modestobacter caceresii TaxID=1522368 RepID=A0A098Y3P6_9ACTN|nr:aminotransferase [Modestobacter caceresii]